MVRAIILSLRYSILITSGVNLFLIQPHDEQRHWGLAGCVADLHWACIFSLSASGFLASIHCAGELALLSPWQNLSGETG